MSATTGTTINLKDAIASLNELAKTPNAAKQTLTEIISEPELLEAIHHARTQRYSFADIAERLKANGIEISPKTLESYYRQIKGGKLGTQKPKAARKKSESTGSTKADPTPPAPQKKEEPQPTQAKTLSTKPSMGGSFDTDNL